MFTNGSKPELHSSLLHCEHVRMYLLLEGRGKGGGGGRIRNTFHSLLFKTIFEADMTEPVFVSIKRGSEGSKEEPMSHRVSVICVFQSEIVLQN